MIQSLYVQYEYNICTGIYSLTKYRCIMYLYVVQFSKLFKYNWIFDYLHILYRRSAWVPDLLDVVLL